MTRMLWLYRLQSVAVLAAATPPEPGAAGSPIGLLLALTYAGA